MEKPKSSLTLRERKPATGLLTQVRNRRRRPVDTLLERPLDRFGNLLEARPLEQPGDGERDPELGLDCVTQLGCHERIEAEGGERSGNLKSRRPNPQGAAGQSAQPVDQIGFLPTAVRQLDLPSLALPGGPGVEGTPRQNDPFPREVGSPAGLTPDFAARRLRDRSRSHQDDLLCLNLVLFRYSLAHRVGYLLEVIHSGMSPNLLDHDETLFAAHLDGEGGAAGRLEGWMGLLSGPFDVLRIKVTTAKDEEIFDPAGDEQLAITKETEIAGPQERPLARLCQDRAEDLVGSSLRSPVSLGHTASRNPDLSDLMGGAAHPGLRIRDHYAQVAEDPAAADDRVRVLLPDSRHHPAARQSCPVEPFDPRLLLRASPGDH